MAILGATAHTLVDVASKLDPNGKVAKIVELLTQYNEVLQDMYWTEGNLPTGDRTSVRTGLPSVAFRRINEGIARSKSTVAAVDEGAAMLEGNSLVDRKLAILAAGRAGGSIMQYRLDEATAFYQAMNIQMASTLFYGNAGLDPKTFNGLATRYGVISGGTGTADNIIDGGGTGTSNTSIWLIGWGDQTVRGIYPQGTKAGIFHHDATANTRDGDDGYPIGDMVQDPNGLEYLAYRDHFEWNCGLSLKDWRYVARGCNIDVTNLVANTSATDLIRMMIIMSERIQELNSVNAAFYCNRTIRTALRLQIDAKANLRLSWEEFAGKKVMTFDGIPIRRTDALLNTESRVV